MQAHPTTTSAPDRWHRRIPAGSGRALVTRKVRTRFRDGDPDAVRVVFRAYGRLVYAVAYRVLGNRGLAEEATQQTFVKAWRAAGSLDESRDMGPWLATIARRVAIDVYRSEAHRSADPIESVAPGDPALGVATGIGRGDMRRLGGSAGRHGAAGGGAGDLPPAALRRPHAHTDRGAAEVAGGDREVALVPGPQTSGGATRTPAGVEVLGYARPPDHATRRCSSVDHCF